MIRIFVWPKQKTYGEEKKTKIAKTNPGKKSQKNSYRGTRSCSFIHFNPIAFHPSKVTLSQIRIHSERLLSLLSNRTLSHSTVPFFPSLPPSFSRLATSLAGLRFRTQFDFAVSVNREMMYDLTSVMCM